MMKTAINSIFCFFLVLNAFAIEIKDNDGAYAKKLVDEKGALLLDVRTLAEYAVSSIDGSKRIHVGDLEDELDKVKEWTKGDKELPIVVFCAVGGRAEKARGILKKAGYKNVVNMGGISNWPGSTKKANKVE